MEQYANRPVSKIIGLVASKERNGATSRAQDRHNIHLSGI